MGRLATAASIAIALLTVAAAPAAADKARWCAQFTGGSHGGSTECLYHTIAQCQATVSGMGGHCFENPWLASSTQERRNDYRRRD